MKERIALALAFLVPGVAVLRLILALHTWASAAFAKPALASALLAVVEMAVVLVALAFVPATAKLVRALLR